jgi:ArsR family transcriptional regulator, cadmium/lead-responsive transcriptional repressor
MAVSTEARSVLFDSLSEPSRLALIEELARGDRRVSDLAAATGLAQPNVSKHLACLWDCGLVERQRQGREIHYGLADGLAGLLSSADEILAASGERVLTCPRYQRRTARRAA